MEIYEIERKYLIEIPNIELLSDKYGITKSLITQIYLETEEDEERIRKREYKGVVELTHTIKKSISGIKRIEVERNISIKEYRELIKRKNRKMMVITKERITFEHSGKTLEIDIYPFWKTKAVLEVELNSETEEFDIPEDIVIIKEVTEDKRYKNKSISKNWGDI